MGKEHIIYESREDYKKRKTEQFDFWLVLIIGGFGVLVAAAFLDVYSPLSFKSSFYTTFTIGIIIWAYFRYFK